MGNLEDTQSNYNIPQQQVIFEITNITENQEVSRIIETGSIISNDGVIRNNKEKKLLVIGSDNNLTEIKIKEQEIYQTKNVEVGNINNERSEQTNEENIQISVENKENVDLSRIRKNSRKMQRNQATWKQNINRQKCQHGKEHLTINRKLME